MIVPVQKDETLLEDIASVGADDSVLHLWWLGQSGFLAKSAGVALLFDPYLSDSLTTKYAATDKPHIRMTERCVDPARLNGIALVTSSHMHTDHFDPQTLIPVFRTNPAACFVFPAANGAAARERLGDAFPSRAAGISDGDFAKGEGWEVQGVIAAHNSVERDEQGRTRFMGFIVRLGRFTIYHSGDTLWHDDIIRDLRRRRCDIGLVPINGNRPERRVAGNLNGTEAAALCRAGKVGLAVPHHFEMFEFNTEPPDEFIRSCERLSQPCRVLRCGERMALFAADAADET